MEMSLQCVGREDVRDSSIVLIFFVSKKFVDENLISKVLNKWKL